MSLIYPDHPQFKAKYPWIVKNGSGEEIPPGAVMAIGSTDLRDGKAVTTVIKPTATFARQYLVNSPIAIANNSSAEGYAGFLEEGGYVYYNTGTPATGEEWGVTSGQWYLTQHRPGFVVTNETTTFNSKGLVYAKGFLVQHVFGKANDAIANGNSGTVRIYGGTQGSESDTSLTIASCYNYGPDIPDEAEVWVGWLHGKPYAQNMGCH